MRGGGFLSRNQLVSHDAFQASVAAAFPYVFLFLIAIVVGLRDDSVGADTSNYRNYFDVGLLYEDRGRFEPLFQWLSSVIRFIYPSSEFYFFTLCVVVTVVYFCTYFVIADCSSLRDRTTHAWVLAGLLAGSSWYLVAVTNGLRQGLAMPFCYLGLVFLLRGRWVFGVASMVFAAGFHTASLLAIPFFLLAALKTRSLVLISLLMMVGYPLGVLEQVVLSVSQGLGLALYSSVKYYNELDGRYDGFQIVFYLYSVGWFLVLFLALYVFRFFEESKFKIAELYFKAFVLLLMPYWVFGFGGYSNRYAMFGWFFLPAVQAYFLMSLKISPDLKRGVAFLCALSGGLVFLDNVFRFI